MADLFGGSDSDDDGVPSAGRYSGVPPAQRARSGSGDSGTSRGATGGQNEGSARVGEPRRAMSGAQRREASLPEAVRHALAAQVRVFFVSEPEFCKTPTRPSIML